MSMPSKSTSTHPLSTPPPTTASTTTTTNNAININSSSNYNNPMIAPPNNNNNAMESVTMMTNYVTFLSTVCGALKQLKRTGWIRHQVPLPESDCDHMHRCAMCAMLVVSSFSSSSTSLSSLSSTTTTTTPAVDGMKLLKMALTHDVCEALAGDITPHCHAELLQSKQEKERAAMKHIRELLSSSSSSSSSSNNDNTNTSGGNTEETLGDELYQLWEEYEEQTTLEAIYCKDIDKFEMVLQAFEYEKQHLRQRQDVADDDDDDDKMKGNSVTVNNDDKDKSSSSSYLHQPVQNHPLRGFFISTNAAMKTTFFQQLDAEVRRQREVMLQERGWTVTDLERQQQQQQQQ